MDKNKIEGIVNDRISQLFKEAEENLKTHPERTRRYIRIARALAMRHRMHLPERFKRTFCKVCYIYWKPGYNVKAKIDSNKKTVSYSCECGYVRRYRYK
jgi:ribonuclease P protein subunit RPR2